MADGRSDAPAGGLVGAWELELVSPACRPGAETWNAKARLDADIGEALAYLNAALAGAKLHAAAGVLVWRDGQRSYAFRPREIAAAPVRDLDEARAAVARAVEIVNDVWRRRGEIRPDFSARQPPALLEIFKLLPRTNCGACGRSTCMAFATDLRESAADLAACEPLTDPTTRHRLAELLGEGI